MNTYSIVTASILILSALAGLGYAIVFHYFLDKKEETTDNQDFVALLRMISLILKAFVACKVGYIILSLLWLKDGLTAQIGIDSDLAWTIWEFFNNSVDLGLLYVTAVLIRSIANLLECGVLIKDENIEKESSMRHPKNSAKATQKDHC